MDRENDLHLEAKALPLPCGETSADPVICSFRLKLFFGVYVKNQSR